MYYNLRGPFNINAIDNNCFINESDLISLCTIKKQFNKNAPVKIRLYAQKYDLIMS